MNEEIRMSDSDSDSDNEDFAELFVKKHFLMTYF